MIYLLLEMITYKSKQLFILLFILQFIVEDFHSFLKTHFIQLWKLIDETDNVSLLYAEQGKNLDEFFQSTAGIIFDPST